MSLVVRLAIVAGVVLLTVVTIAYGGTFMLRVVTGRQGANDLQKSFFRAGHAHAGVLVILGLVTLLLLDAARITGWAHTSAIGVPTACSSSPRACALLKKRSGSPCSSSRRSSPPCRRSVASRF